MSAQTEPPVIDVPLLICALMTGKEAAIDACDDNAVSFIQSALLHLEQVVEAGINARG